MSLFKRNGRATSVALELAIQSVKRKHLQAVSLHFFTLLIIASGNGEAAFSSTWSSRPSWASSNYEESAAPSRPSAKEAAYHPTSPFAPGSNNLSLDVGQVFLMGDLSDRYDSNIGSRVRYTYGVSDIFAFDSSFGYSSHSDGKYSMATLLTGMRMNLSWYDKVVPYVVVGLGFFKPSYSFDEGSSISPLIFGLHAGPGVNLELTKQLYFGASLTFHDMFGTYRTLQDGTRFEVDGTFTSFFLSVGVTF